MVAQSVSIPLPDGRTITLESGRMAKQAGGSVVARLGDTMVLCTVCAGEDKPADFFPLTVEYREKFYAAGKIPGGYFKREAKLSDREVLACRIIDRPLRPMFPEGYVREVQIICTVISADDQNDAETIALVGASAALGLSHIPFEDQVAGVRVIGSRDGKFIINPTFEQVEGADIELIVAGTSSSILMVEGSAYEVSEDLMVSAILAGHEAIKNIVKAQNELISKFTVEKDVFVPKPVDEVLFKRVEAVSQAPLKELFHKDYLKKAYYAGVKVVKKQVQEALATEFPEREGDIAKYFEDVLWRDMREMVLSEKRRIDGRGTTDIRPIDIETSVLPRAHGSALFQRGETQGLVVTTLGTRVDEQRVESLQGETFKNYMLHYNFPGFSVGEAKRLGAVGRREVGHGFLAERALAPVLPTSESFPYTIRIVSDILESHGSSSMASVCGGSLSLMDAGVKIKAPVAGIAMGMVSDGARYETLSDINGTEDHLGDMDFKVCGTENGITSFQMDIKLRGITSEMMHKALNQARAGRLHILSKMNAALPAARDLSKLAPAIIQKQIPSEKIKDLIGPGGKVIRGIQENTGANLDVNDTGMVTISAPHRGNALMALKMVNEIFAEAEVGKIYKGKVKGITTFGCFVEILPGKEGLVHISELAPQRVEKVEDVVAMGDELEVKCIGVDPQGKIKLSRKALLQPA
ncbi:MAG TPA: polyribonucleotide nucleotidyltransferase [Fibrobacteres bacterium]|nr:polyribonucleotide nucleotidyltransferase [Fibrobacterota bacterium]